MIILIPWWSGFVWRNLVKKLLNQGNKIIVIDKDNLNLKNENLIFYKKNLLTEDLDSFLNKKFKIDFIINCIWKQYVNTKIPYFNRQNFFDKTNVWITKKLLVFSVKENIKKFIFISTDMVYWVPKYLPIDEKHCLNPVWPYWISKLKAEKLIKWYGNKWLNTLIIRPRFIIWKWRWWVMEKLVKLFKLNFPVPLFWNWKNHYQMINVDDLNNFLILSLNKDIEWIVNIGSKETSSFLDLYKILKNKLNSKSLIFTTSHSLNKIIFNIFDKIWLAILYKDQYEIADKEYKLDIKLAESFWWSPKISDKDSILEVIWK